MTALRDLPFQFQQRGADLAAKLKEPDGFKRYTEQRDQDLENFLANLPSGGSRVGAVGWFAPTINGGNNDLLGGVIGNPDWGPPGFVGKAWVDNGDGTVTWTGDTSAAAILLIESVLLVEYTGATTNGLLGVIAPLGYHMIAVDAAAAATYGAVQAFSDTRMAAVAEPTLLGTASYQVQAIPSNMGIAGLTGPDYFNFNGLIINSYMIDVN